MILADSNVLLDVITADPKWGRWSLAALDEWARRGPILVNPVIYAEIAPAYDTLEGLDAAVEAVGLELREIPRAALFLASRAFVRYRRRGGARRGVLPDFFVGAHAAVLDIPLLTRDTHRYRAYFPPEFCTAFPIVSPAPVSGAGIGAVALRSQTVVHGFLCTSPCCERRHHAALRRRSR